MKPGLPWSVKGIEPDVREAAKQAARRSGMTLGEWLNSTILEQADGGEGAPVSEAGPRARSSAPSIERAANRLEDIAEKLSRLSLQDSAAAARFGIHAVDRQEPDHEALQKVLNRVESNERQTVEAFTAVNERLSSLSRQLAQAKPVSSQRPEDHPGYIALEKAVRNIVEHMEASDKHNRETLKSLQDRITDLSTRAKTADSEQILRQVPAFGQLESRLSDLAKRVERSEQTPQQQQGLAELLRREITDLAKRIDTVRENSEVLASRAQTQAVQASQQELRAIENRILGLLKEAQTSLSGASAGPAELQRLRNEIERLNRRIDESQSQVASGSDLLALRAAMEQLSTRVAQVPDMRPLADMDRRILDITERLEETQAAAGNLPKFADLESRIAELDYRFNEVMAGRVSPQSDGLEGRIADVADRLGRTEQQLASLETIERAVTQLFNTFEQQRKWTEEVAESAASRMAERMLAHLPQGGAPSGSAEIQALEQGLSAVKAAAETADQRNQETLEAVHDTLEQIVGKLAELEAATIGQRVAAAVAPAQPMTPAAPSPASPQAQDFGNPFEAAAPINNPFEMPPESLPPILAAPDNLPANPFEQAFHGIQPQAAGTGTFGAGAAGATPDDDFIAAARRAANAANQQKSLLSGISPGAARISEESSRKLLNLSFLKRKSADTAGSAGLSGEIKPPPGFKPANGNETASKRRKLLLMGLVLLAAVSAFTYNMMGRSPAPKAPAVAPTAIEQPVGNPQANPQSMAPAPTPVPAPKKPEPVKSGLLEPDIDPVLTGSLPQTMGTPSLEAVVAGQVATPESLPPAEVGNQKLREAAALGDPNAQFVIATRYLNGERVAQDYAKAAYWYGKAASHGLAPAQYRVGTMYERGKGVARDMKAAFGWYEQAAILGNVKAMHNAAVLASGNDLGKPDYKTAFKWFSLGAAHGLKDSQFNLAVLFERGLGTKASPRDAYFWYSVAARQDDAEAKKRASLLAKSMSQGDLLAMKTKLASWTPEKAPDSGNIVAVNNAEWNAIAQNDR